MILNHNMSAVNAHRMFSINEVDSVNTMEKLSSGMRINRASDDAAGLAISEKMRAQVRGLNMASRNAQDAINFVKTAEGYLSQVQVLLHRLRELSVQSATGTYTNEDRYMIKTEAEQLIAEIDRLANSAEYNTINMLKGGLRAEESKTPWDPMNAAQTGSPFPALENQAVEGDVHERIYQPTDSATEAGGLYIQIGANMDQRFKLYIQNNSAVALGLKDAGTGELVNEVKLLTQDDANKAIKIFQGALNYVSAQRADLGAFQNRLEGIVKTVDYAAENLQASESFIRDQDMAEAMVDFVKQQILAQSTAAMLTQANLRPHLLLQIIG